MLAWLSAALFFIATLISGHAIGASSPWFQPVTLIGAGLCCLVLAWSVPAPWGRRP